MTSDWLSCTSTTEPVSSSSKRFFFKRPPTIEDEVKRLLPRADGEELSERATVTPLECPLEWARESNAYCCVSTANYFKGRFVCSNRSMALESTVFSYTSGEDLCTSSYYTNAVPVVSHIAFVFRSVAFSKWTSLSD